MEIIYIGQFDGKFNYRIHLNGHSFNYYTGLGHTLKLTMNKKRKHPDKDRLFRHDNTDKFDTFIYRIHPKESDVLECLKSDCEIGSMSFNDFCDNFGCSNDSLKALDVYRACQDTAIKLRGFKFPEVENE